MTPDTGSGRAQNAAGKKSVYKNMYHRFDVVITFDGTGIEHCLAHFLDHGAMRDAYQGMLLVSRKLLFSNFEIPGR